MSLTKISFSMINGAPINVLDYGADPTGTANSSTAINLALATGRHIYIPQGTYRLDSALTPMSNQTIQGDGCNATVLSANTVGMTCINYPSGYWSNVQIRDLNVDGNSKAAIGINLVSANQGAVSNCLLDNITSANNTLYNVYAYQATYSTFNRLNLSYGQYGLFLFECYDVLVSNSLMYESSKACLNNFKGSQNKFVCNHLFNGLVFAPSLLILDGGSGMVFDGCTFEPTAINGVTYEVIIKSTTSGLNAVPVDCLFINCRWIGQTAMKTNCVYVATVGAAYKITFQLCQFIKPTGASIVLGSQQYTSIIQCVDLAGYDTLTYAPVTVSNTGGNPYYQENLPGNFLFTVSANAVTATSFVSTGTVSTQWISGTGSPEGIVVASKGCLFSRTDGGASTCFYVKETASGNTGWVAK
jgi:hypothetical protein